MKIYDDYLDTIKTAISSDKKYRSKFSALSANEVNIEKAFSYANLNESVPQKRLLPSLSALANELGLAPNFDQQLGLHPDFAHLKGTDNIENHYIVSLFIDIKGSTNLFSKYEPETVLIINTTTQRAAIHTCLIFGGYVHRLQGDGLMVYFGGKGKEKTTAALRALQSASVFTYFVKYDLKKLSWSQQGIDKIFTRIGIDLGDDKDVLWSMAGIGEISEVTTCSLHTSLASKMQASADSNGIVIGDNVKNTLGLQIQNLVQPVSMRTGKQSDKYIFQIMDASFNYTQYDLDWLNFLKRQDFILTNMEGELSLKKKTNIPANRNIENLKPFAVPNKPYYYESGKLF
jgi:class 3 adenylate cyclase